MRVLAITSLISFMLLSCGGSSVSDSGRKTFNDLPFEKADNAKDYADLILKSIRTNRDKPIAQEFTNNKEVDLVQLRRMVGMYSTGLTGRSDWEEYDIFAESNKKDFSNGFDYAWLEPKGRLGMQIYILPKQNESGRFTLEKLEFRSRINVIESFGFPAGKINDYKKLDFKW
ncbi:MAG: hypothetical protein P8M34_00960 [Saprospiraceae bacterium]|nr:hypothetical protein [Saprospiraceae bacterium]